MNCLLKLHEGTYLVCPYIAYRCKLRLTLAKIGASIVIMPPHRQSYFRKLEVESSDKPLGSRSLVDI